MNTIYYVFFHYHSLHFTFLPFTIIYDMFYYIIYYYSQFGSIYHHYSIIINTVCIYYHLFHLFHLFHLLLGQLINVCHARSSHSRLLQGSFLNNQHKVDRQGLHNQFFFSDSSCRRAAIALARPNS